MDEEKLKQFEEIVKNGGLAAGLLFLNSRVAHRCTVVYRVDGDNLKMIKLVDKQANPETAQPAAVPFTQSFCQVTLQDGPLSTSDSGPDSRLDGKTHQGVVKSYVGVPLSHSPGTFFGTLCHYDFQEQAINDDEFAFMQQAAVILARTLQPAI